MHWLQALTAHYGYQSRTDIRQVGAVQMPPGAHQDSVLALSQPPDLSAAETAMFETLEQCEDSNEPLVALARLLGLTQIELKFVVLALAPELDTVYQHFFAKLQHLDNCCVGTLGIYAGLVGDPVDVRQQLACSGNLVRWRLLEGAYTQSLPAADEPLRLDRHLVDWLAGNSHALEQDLRLRRVLRSTTWPGGSLMTNEGDVQPAMRLLRRLQHSSDSTCWLLFNGDQPATWQATLERAAQALDAPALRVQGHRVAALDVAESGETAARLVRLARLSLRPLLMDTSGVAPSADGDDALRHLLAELVTRRCSAGIISTNLSWCVGLLSGHRVEVVRGSALPHLTRRLSLQSAAERLDIALSDEVLDGLEQQLPLQADGWERALRLTFAQRQSDDTPGQLARRFIAACRDVASESLSGLAMRDRKSVG